MDPFSERDRVAVGILDGELADAVEPRDERHRDAHAALEPIVQRVDAIFQDYRATEEELGELVAAADAFSEVRASVDVDSVAGVRRLHEANRRFHDAIITAARHRRLESMLARTVDIPLVFRAFQSFGAAEIERSDTFHHLIAEAMCRRDAARAASLMAEHIAQGRDAVLDTLAMGAMGTVSE